jgi:hypothetical protein
MSYISKSFYACFFFFSFFLLTNFTANATHIAGGQFSYKCLGFDGDNITLELYLDFRRDCFNAQPGAVFDNPANVGIFDATTGQLLTGLGFNGTLGMVLNDVDTLNQIQTSECKVLGDDVCVETTRYVQTITLPYRPTGYLFAYQRCCRNITLTNIVAPDGQGTTQLIEITGEAQLTCNASPQFKEWPPVYVCAGNDFNFDHSATDEEGDQLLYKLHAPFIGGSMMNPAPFPASSPPYQEVIWESGFDLNNLLGPSINPLTIDPMTGEMTAMPNSIGQYLVGVVVEEFRDGELLSTTYRDFEVNVRICLEDAEVFVEEYKCPNDTLIFDNETIIEPGEYIFNYETIDGCDSTVFLTVFNFEDEETVLQTSICEGESVIVNGIEYLNAGTYFQEFETGDGCDSIVIIEIEADFNCDDCQPRPNDDLNVLTHKINDNLFELDINGKTIQLNKDQLSAFINQSEYFSQVNDKSAFNRLCSSDDLLYDINTLIKTQQTSISKSYQFVLEARNGTTMNISFKFHKK